MPEHSFNRLKNNIDSLNNRINELITLNKKLVENNLLKSSGNKINLNTNNNNNNYNNNNLLNSNIKKIILYYNQFKIVKCSKVSKTKTV